MLNLVGAFLSVEVAVTVTTSVLKVQDSKTGALIPNIDASMGLTIIFAGLIGGILWNLLTWLFGIPSSSSHALFGGLIGAGLAALGMAGVNWTRGHLEGADPGGRRAAHRVPGRRMRHLAGLPDHPQGRSRSGAKTASAGARSRTASLVALSHGTNDAQKTMGVIALALITTGHLTGDVKKDGLPFWIIFSCALAIGLGTYIGGWRVIRTLGKGLVEIESPQGFAAEASSAAIILSSSRRGYGAVDHPRGDRLDPRQRCRQAGRGGALGGRRPDGRRVAGHPACRRTRRRVVVLALPRGQVADRLGPRR